MSTNVSLALPRKLEVPAQTSKQVTGAKALCAPSPTLLRGKKATSVDWGLFLAKVCFWRRAKQAGDDASVYKDAPRFKKTSWLRYKSKELEQKQCKKRIWSSSRTEAIKQASWIGAGDGQPYFGRYTIGHRVM